MATIPSGITLPSPVAAALGITTGVGLPTLPGAGVYHFSRLFYSPKSAMYLVTVWLNGPGLIRVGNDLASLQTVLTPGAGSVVNAHIYLPRGVSRMDISVEPEDAMCFGMRIFQPDGTFYASTVSGWVYEVGSPADDVEVPAAGIPDLPVFSILPDWSENITESIAYLTEVATSETAHENPRIVRHKARRTFEAQFLREGTARMRMDAFLIGVGVNEFWLPLWHEQFYEHAGIAAASPSITLPAGTLAYREFQVGDTVLVNRGDPEDYELLRVAELDFDTDVLTWESGPTRDWPPGTRIFPCRLARLLESSEMRGPVDTVFIGRARFTLTRPEYRFGPSWGSAGNVWTFRINRAEDMTFAYASVNFINDNNVGPLNVTSIGTRSLVTTKASMAFFNRQEVVAFRRFVEIAAGREGRFYMPTYMSDIKPIGPTVVGTTFSAQPAGFTEFVKVKKAARSVLAFDIRGEPELVLREILDVTRIGDEEVFTLDAALPSTPVAQIQRVQFMVPSRFDQDTFELAHTVDESMCVLASVATRSVDAIPLPP